MAKDAPNFLQGLTACFGFPVAENPTQAMIEPAYAAMGLAWRYLTVEVRPENLGDAVRGARAMGFKGFNCTIPHKVEVIRHLDELTPAAEKIGAVNCVAIRDGRLLGENTDGKGFLQSLRGVIDPQGKRIVLLGAGGAARAIAVELALADASAITVVNRSAERGQSLVDRLNEKTKTPATLVNWDGDFRVAAETDVLVNATSIGLNDESARVPVNLDDAQKTLVVADVIASPPLTRLVRKSQQRGFKTLDGVGMIVNQGAIGFKLWTGVDADIQVMREAAEEFVET